MDDRCHFEKRPIASETPAAASPFARGSATNSGTSGNIPCSLPVTVSGVCVCASE